MKDAEFKQQQDRVRAVADWWIPKLNLEWVHIEFAYARDDFAPDASEDPAAVAVTRARWRYCDATITWNMPAVMQKSDEDLEWIMVHELQHIFLNETREDGEDWFDHEERVASVLATAFIQLRDAMKKPEKSGRKHAATA